MTDPAAVGFALAAGAALLASGVFLLSMWHRRSEPMAVPLLGVAAVAALSALLQTVLHGIVSDEAFVEFWIYGVYLTGQIGMGLWVYFTFQYTGRGRRVTSLVGVSILGMVGLSVLTAALAGLLHVSQGVELVNLVTGTSTVLVLALTVVSAFALVDETVQGNQYLFREALAHAGGIIALGFTPFVAGLYQQATAVLAMVAVSSTLFLVAIHRYSLFDTLPVARVAGRDRVVNEIAAPVVVVDRGGTVQDLNTATEECFGVEAAAAVGRPLESIVHGPTEPAVIAETEEPIPLQTPDGRTLTVSADRVTDSRDRLCGYLLRYRDVTERRERERRLGVLNQLLVGAVRERMERVAARAAALERDGDDQAYEAAQADIWSTTTALTGLVDRAREVERTLTADGEQPADLVGVVRRVAAEAGVAALDLPEEPLPVAAPEPLLETVVGMLLADVFEGEGLVTVGFEGDGRPTLRVTTAGGDTLQSGDEFTVDLLSVAVDHSGGELAVSDDGAVLVLPAAPETSSASAGADNDRLGVQR